MNKMKVAAQYLYVFTKVRIFIAVMMFYNCYKQKYRTANMLCGIFVNQY